MNLSITIAVLDVDEDTKIAVCRLGGINVNGKPASTAKAAVRNLLWTLAGQDNDANAALGLSLAMAGKSMESTLAALSDGGK